VVVMRKAACTNGGQRPSAGWASNIGSRHFMVQPASPEFLGTTVAERPPEGADGRCPAAPRRLDSGQGRDATPPVALPPEPRRMAPSEREGMRCERDHGT